MLNKLKKIDDNFFLDFAGFKFELVICLTTVVLETNPLVFDF